MRRLASALLAASVSAGCVHTNAPVGDFGGHVVSWDRKSIRHVPGVCGPHGERVPMSASAMHGPHSGPPIPMSMMPPPPPGMAPPGMMPPGMMPPGMIQQTSAYGPGGPIMQANHPMSGPPGGMGGPGMGGPGMGGPGGMAAMSAQPRFPAQRTQVRFARPSGMKVSWFTQGPDGKQAYSNVPVEAPGRYNFPQAAIYRLKLSNIEGRPGLEVYPTMEVVPTNPKTESFLAHSSVPVEFTPEDFKNIAEGSYVVKVIYLPDPQFQDAASTGTEEILSTRLEPGVDPIQEAIRRGSILLIIRMGNVDQEAPNTPPLNSVAPGMGMNPMMNFVPMRPGQPGTMVPFGNPGAPMPPGLMSSGPAPGALPPAISSMPLPSNGATPTSRPGTASVSAPPLDAGPSLR